MIKKKKYFDLTDKAKIMLLEKKKTIDEKLSKLFDSLDNQDKEDLKRILKKLAETEV